MFMQIYASGDGVIHLVILHNTTRKGRFSNSDYLALMELMEIRVHCDVSLLAIMPRIYSALMTLSQRYIFSGIAIIHIMQSDNGRTLRRLGASSNATRMT